MNNFPEVSNVASPPSPEFWRGKRVFLTGHTGFKGGWLAFWLVRMGAVVQGYALAPPAGPNFFELLRLAELLDHRVGDVRDQGRLAADMDAFGPDIVIHMAAQPLVLESYETPVATFETNVMGTVNLLEAALHCRSVRATLIVTTDKCYENDGPPVPHKETDRLGGRDPYSSSKACAELVSAAYAKSFFMKAGKAVATVRAGNVIGGGDWSPNRLMSDIITALIRGEPVLLRAPQAVRPWQHVLEPLNGYLVAAETLFENLAAGDAWNFGPAPDDAATVLRVATLACEFWGAGIRPTIAPSALAEKEAFYLALDSTKAKDELGWVPRWRLDKAVRLTVDWYVAWYNSQDMRQVTLDQIAAYIEPAT